MTNSPCYGCENRREACHGTCEVYKDWRHDNQFDKVSEKRDRGRAADELLSDGRYRGWRMYKRGR